MPTARKHSTMHVPGPVLQGWKTGPQINAKLANILRDAPIEMTSRYMHNSLFTLASPGLIQPSSGAGNGTGGYSNTTSNGGAGTAAITHTGSNFTFTTTTTSGDGCGLSSPQTLMYTVNPTSVTIVHAKFAITTTATSVVYVGMSDATTSVASNAVLNTIDGFYIFIDRKASPVTTVVVAAQKDANLDTATITLDTPVAQGTTINWDVVLRLAQRDHLDWYINGQTGTLKLTNSGGSAWNPMVSLATIQTSTNAARVMTLNCLNACQIPVV